MVAFGLYRHTGAVFTKTGTVEFKKDIVIINKGKHKKILINSIKKVKWEKSKLYGTNFGILIISYESDNKSKIYSIISEDLTTKRTESCSL